MATENSNRQQTLRSEELVLLTNWLVTLYQALEDALHCYFHLILWDRYYYYHHFTDKEIGLERWSDSLKAAQQVVELNLKPDSLNTEPMLLTTLILPRKNMQTSQSITSSHLREIPLPVTWAHKYFNMPGFYNWRISRTNSLCAEESPYLLISLKKCLLFLYFLLYLLQFFFSDGISCFSKL